jgi:LysR family hydrogen peroxide-inducible transcriptional activator
MVRFILFKPGSGLRQVALHLGQTAGFTPRVIFESGDIGSIRALVAEGVGISVFPVQ